MLANAFIPFPPPWSFGLHYPATVFVALAAEFVVFYLIQRGIASLLYVFLTLTAANFCSTVFGFILVMTMFFPKKTRAVAFGFWFLCFILSILVEYLVLFLFPTWRRHKGRLLGAIVAGNAASYAVLAIPLYMGT